jgi:hypothetical protein
MVFLAMAPKEKAEMASSRRAKVVRTRRPGKGPIRTIAVRFPVAYLKIIEKEADLVGVSRGQFLSMLVKRQEGSLLLERSQDAPTHEVDEKELEATQLYMWQAPAPIRDRIDSERLRMGNLGVAAYLTVLVNHWLGEPLGLKIRKK